MNSKRLVILALWGSGVFILSFTGPYNFKQEPWKAPAWADTLKNPYLVEPLTLPQAQEVYMIYCASCHGEKGHGDAGKVFAVKPLSFKDKKVKNQSDGALFWKLNEGKGDMPSFKDVLSEEQKWQLVEYIRDISKPFHLQSNPFKSEN